MIRPAGPSTAPVTCLRVKHKSDPRLVELMQAKPEYRDRDETEVAVLDALADRPQEGMTVFEIRSHVDADIDSLEAALESLKHDDLIEATNDDQRTVIVPDDSVVGAVESDEEGSFIDEIRRRLPL